MDRDEVGDAMVAVCMWMISKLRRGRQRRHLLLAYLRRRQERYSIRGPYCNIQCLNQEIVAILCGDEKLTMKHVRVTPDALRLYCSKLRRKGHGYSTEFEAIVFLYWLGCGTSFRVVAISFNLPRSTVHMLVQNALNETVGLLNEVIILPVGPELEVVGEGFAERCRSPVFRQAVGAIDGCHIRTMVPQHLHDQYINRKLFYSLNLQGLVDHRGMFIDIFAGFPGSCHDMRVLRHSLLFRQGTYPPVGYFIIGDGGYQLLMHPITLVIPFKAPLTQAQRNFNYHLSRGRCKVECTFAEMEIRWRSIYTKALEVSLKTGVKVLCACAIMHNICLTAGDILRVDVSNRRPERRPNHEEAGAVQFRNMLLDLHTAYQNQQ